MKKILKLLFPVIFLRRIFFYYNKIKKSFFDKIVFPEYKANSKEIKLYRNINQYKTYGLAVRKYKDPTLQEGMDYWLSWEQEEYIVEINKKCKIEPKQGWALIKNKILLFSLGLGKEDYVNYPSFLQILFKRYTKVHLKSVISFRDTGEENYFHFYNDILTKLYLLESHGYNVENYAIVISEALSQKEYFKYFHSTSSKLNQLNWVVQKENDFIVCENSVFCKPITHSKPAYRYIRDMFKISSETNHFSDRKKIFITRKNTSFRYIENMSEVSPLLKLMGFDIVDTSDLSMLEQIQLFSHANCICGIHGAGLTNMIFCMSSDVKIVEIFPPMTKFNNYLPYHYLILSTMLGFDYNAIVGERSSSNYSGGFSVNLEKLKEIIP